MPPAAPSRTYLPAIRNQASLNASEPYVPVPPQQTRISPPRRTVLSASAPLDEKTRLQQMAFQAAAKYGVPAKVFLAQIGQESSWRPGVTSRDGGQGIAQFMPATAQQYGLANPYDPSAALLAAAHYDSDLLHQYGTIPRALSAYNSGSPTGAPDYAAKVLAASRSVQVPTVTMHDALTLGLPAATARAWPQT